MNTKRKTAPKSAFSLKGILILLAMLGCSVLLLLDFAGQPIEMAPVAAQDAECYAGLVVNQGEQCTYPGTSSDFSVDSSGRGRFLFASSLVIISITNANVNGVTYTFIASARDDGSWVVDVVWSASSANPIPTATQTVVPLATSMPIPTATATRIPVASPTAAASPLPAPTPTPAPAAVPTPAAVATASPTASSQQAGVPASPANVRAVWEGSSVRVNWNGSAGATHYKVYHDDFFGSSCRISSFGTLFGCDELSSSVSGTTYLHTSPDDRRNHYWVTACNSGGCSEIDRHNAVQPGDPSQAASPTVGATAIPTPVPTPTPAPAAVPTPAAVATASPTASSQQAGVPASPANVRAVWEGSSVRVNWNGSAGATHYKVYHDDFFGSSCRISSFGTLFGCDELSSSVSGTTYLHTSPDDRRNHYWVTACNSGGCSEIDRHNAVQPGDPSQAASPTVGATAIPTPVPTPTPAPEAVPPPTRAVATVSPTASSQQAGVPASPANVRAVWEGSSVRVNWNGSAGATHYKVYHDDFFGSSCRISSFGTLFGCDELSSSVSGTTYLHTSPDDRRNHYWVTACNSGGCSEIDRYNAVQPGDPSQAASPTVGATAIPTPVPTPTPAPAAVPTPAAVATASPTASSQQAGVPASPANVRAVWEGSSVRVNWNGSAGATHYKVYHDDFFGSSCRISSFGTLFGCDELSSSVSGTTYLHTSPDDRRNHYWVTACNSGGCSEIDRYNAVQPGDPSQAASPTVGATAIPTPVPTPTPAPEAVPTPTGAVATTSPTASSQQAGVPASPANVRAVWEGSSVRVNWNGSAGATHYKVYHDDFFGSSCRISSFGTLFGCDELSSSVSGTTYLHTSPDDRRNHYWVTACNSGGCSEIDRYNAVQPGDPSQAASPTVGATAIPTPAPTPTPMATQVPVATPIETPAAAAIPTTIAMPTPTPYAGQQASAPAPPTSVRAVYGRGRNEARIDWDRVERATYYKVYVSLWADCSEPENYLCPEVASRVTGTSYVDTMIAFAGSGEVTHYYVRACNSDGCSSLVGAPTLMPTPVPTPTPTPATPTPTATAAPDVAGQPDVVVDTLTVSNRALTVNEIFSLNAVIRNQGSGPANFVSISFYRSTDNSTNTVSDDTVENSYTARSSWNDWDDWTYEMSPSDSWPAPTEARAPSVAGTYYYYGCVSSHTGNNCSDTVMVTVAAPAPTPTPIHLFPPTDVRAVFGGPRGVEISWTAVAGADYYLVYHNYFNNILGSSRLGKLWGSEGERMSYAHATPRRDSNFYFIQACPDAVERPYDCALARPVWVGGTTTQRPNIVPTPGFLRPTPTPVPGIQSSLNFPDTPEEAHRRWLHLYVAALYADPKYKAHASCGSNSTRPCPSQDHIRWWISLPPEAQACAAHGICW